jgi:hypothetical protein
MGESTLEESAKRFDVASNEKGAATSTSNESSVLVLHATEKQCILVSKDIEIFIFQANHKLCSTAVSKLAVLLTITYTTCCSSLELPHIYCTVYGQLP